MKPEINPNDIARVQDYMTAHHCGYKNATPRQNIAIALNMPDRYFREVCSEIPEIITSIHYGYWILPLVDPVGLETMVAREVLDKEDRRRIIALYLRNRKQRKAIQNMTEKNKQLELSLNI